MVIVLIIMMQKYMHSNNMKLNNLRLVVYLLQKDDFNKKY